MRSAGSSALCYKKWVLFAWQSFYVLLFSVFAAHLACLHFAAVWQREGIAREDLMEELVLLAIN